MPRARGDLARGVTLDIEKALEKPELLKAMQELAGEESPAYRLENQCWTYLRGWLQPGRGSSPYGDPAPNYLEEGLQSTLDVEHWAVIPRYTARLTALAGGVNHKSAVNFFLNDRPPTAGGSGRPSKFNVTDLYMSTNSALTIGIVRTDPFIQTLVNPVSTENDISAFCGDASQVNILTGQVIEPTPDDGIFIYGGNNIMRKLPDLQAGQSLQIVCIADDTIMAIHMCWAERRPPGVPARD